MGYWRQRQTPWNSRVPLPFSEEPLPTPFPYCLDRVYDTKTMLSWTSNISPFRIRNSSAGCVPSAATFTVAVWRHCVTAYNLSIATEHSDALIHLIQGHESHRSGLSYGVMSTIPLSTTNKDINLPNSFSTFLRCFVQIKGWARLCSVIWMTLRSETQEKAFQGPCSSNNSIYAILCMGASEFGPAVKRIMECCVRCSSLDRGHNYIKLYTVYQIQTLHFLMANQSSLDMGCLGKSNDPCQKKVQICTCTHAGDTKSISARVKTGLGPTRNPNKTTWDHQERSSLLSWEWSLFQTCKMKINHTHTHMTSVLSMDVNSFPRT